MRDDGAELGRAVHDLDAGLHPVPRVCAHEDPGLVELRAVVQSERDLHRGPGRQRSEETVPVVVDEVIGGRAPEVAAFGGRDDEIVAIRGDLRRGVEPVA